MATSGHRWNATEVLKIQNLFTCVGYAPSKRRKCQNPLAAANREWALEILDRLENVDVVTTSVKKDLQELAPRILCQRNHQDQAPTMVNRWLAEVENLKTERIQQRMEAATYTRRTSQPEHRRERLPRPQAPTISTPSRDAARTREPIVIQEIATPRRQPQTQQLPSPPPTPTHRTSRSVSAAAPSPSSRPASRSDIAPPAASPPALSPSAVTPTPEAASIEPPTPLVHAHQEPTPHTASLEECSICYEDIPANTSISSNCDHHFHAGCINTWLSTQDSLSRAHLCPYCRSEWTRRKVEGNCSICSDSLLHGHNDDDDDEGDDDDDDNGEDDDDADEGNKDDDDNDDGDGDDDDDDNEVDDDSDNEVTDDNGDQVDDDNNNDEGNSDNDEASEEEQEELVWCRACCGQNFHKECMDSWLAACAALERRGNCPSCRANWVVS